MPRVCQVTFQDLDGVRHTVEVTADSVYEAACLAIRALRKAHLVTVAPSPASKLEVTATEAVVSHCVTVGQVQQWLSLGSSNPNEQAKRKRLRALLA